MPYLSDCELAPNSYSFATELSCWLTEYLTIMKMMICSTTDLGSSQVTHFQQVLSMSTQYLWLRAHIMSINALVPGRDSNEILDKEIFKLLSVIGG